jgi:hypothetical protein
MSFTPAQNAELPQGDRVLWEGPILYPDFWQLSFDSFLRLPLILKASKDNQII